MPSSAPLPPFQPPPDALDWTREAHWSTAAGNDAGANLLILGDSRQVLPCLPSASVDLVHTSPPYNIDKHYADSSDDLRQDEYLQFLSEVFSECLRVLRPGASFFLQTGYCQDGGSDIVPIDILCHDALRSMGYRLWDRIVWHYRGGMAFKRKFKNTHETILWWVKPRGDGSFQPRFEVDAVRERSTSYDPRNHLLGKNPGNVWSEDRVAFGGHKRDTTHIAVYPEAITERIIRSCTKPGDVVLDPFAGSGTTPAMARALGRRWVAVEVSPTYVEEAQSRIGRKQASETATLASGLLKLVGFRNNVGRRSLDHLVDLASMWMKSVRLDGYARFQQENLDPVFEGRPFESRERKDRKPSVWLRFDDFFARGEVCGDPLLLVNALLDAAYPQRRTWNGVRKFMHSREVLAALLEMFLDEPRGLVENVVAAEPSSFRLCGTGRAVGFLGPALPIGVDLPVIDHAEPTGERRQASIFADGPAGATMC